MPSPARTELPKHIEIEQSLWADVREGAVFIGRRPPLMWLLATFVVANMALAPMPIIVPLLVKFNLSADWAARGYSFETALALLGVASGTGGVLGGLAVTIWGGLKHRRVYGVLLPMLVGGILQAVYGFSPLLLVSAFAAFLGAATGPLLNAHSQAIWQSHTPREMQGRVLMSISSRKRVSGIAGLSGYSPSAGTRSFLLMLGGCSRMGKAPKKLCRKLGQRSSGA